MYRYLSSARRFSLDRGRDKRLFPREALHCPAPDARLILVAAVFIVRSGGSPRYASLGFPGGTSVNHAYLYYSGKGEGDLVVSTGQPRTLSSVGRALD